jgi:septin family protein
VRVEICESKYNRLMLSVIDTPGLDFHDGLALERQVSSIVKYVETQFADTLSEVSCLLHSLTILIAINAWVAWDMLGI